MVAINNSGPSLAAATATGPGTAITFTSVCTKHGMQVNVTEFAGSGQARVTLEVSNDDAAWQQVGSVAVNGVGTYWVNAAQGTNWPALYARGNLSSIDPGVSAISVSSICASE